MHTPGAWTLNDGGTSIVVSGGPNNDDIADFSYCEEHTVSITREEALANARLFVAAPMMLALLDEFAAATHAIHQDIARAGWMTRNGRSVSRDPSATNLRVCLLELLAVHVIIGRAP